MMLRVLLLGRQFFGLGGDQEIWQDVTSRVMLSSEEYAEVVASEGLAGMYIDPKLSRIQKEYGCFLRDMETRSMIDFGTSASVTPGILFVYKKNSRLRLIVDARRVNQRCRTSVSVFRSSGDTLSALEADPQSFLHVASADVADSFHRMRLPPFLRGFFDLPAIEARPSSITELNGMPVFFPREHFCGTELYVADGFCVVTLFRSACSRICA